MMRIGTIIRALLAAVLFGTLTLFGVLILAPTGLPLITGGTRGKHITEQKYFAAMFKAGDTNAPLLAMDWFSEHGVYFCRVKQSGAVFSARDVGHAIQGGSGISSRFSLGNTNRAELEAAINDLPPSPGKSLPKERQILVSGIRSNQWFARVYDRANIPLEVEKLCEVTGAYLEWFIPRVGSRPEGAMHSMSGHDPNSFAIARDAAVAFSTCANSGFQIWDLKGRSPTRTAVLDRLPYPWKEYANNLWGVQAITPDGRTVIFAVRDVLFAVDWQSQQLLWHRNQIELGNTYHANNRTLAIGNRGRSLFVVEANSIERWNVADGTKISTLATNAAGVTIMQASQDGEMLLAGFGDKSFVLWKADHDEPVFRFAEQGGATCVAISPDSHQIVLNTYGNKKLAVYDWQRGRRNVFPLRTPYASSSAYGLYWSPDPKYLAAHIDTYPSAVVVYETDAWKPIAIWPCGAIGSHSEFAFTKQGVLFQLIDGTINSLDTTRLKAVAE